MDSKWVSTPGSYAMGSRRSSLSSSSRTGDRFIPRRRNSDFEGGYYKLLTNQSRNNSESDAAASPDATREGESLASFRNRLASAGQVATKADQRILSFCSTPGNTGRRSSVCSLGSPLDNSLGGPVFQSPPTKTTRHVSSTPMGVREMPSVSQDRYHRVLFWSSTDKVIVAIASSIFCWNPTTNTCLEIQIRKEETETEQCDVTCVAASSDAENLAIGMSDGRFLCHNWSKGSLELLARSSCPFNNAVCSISWEKTGRSPSKIFYGARLCGCVLRFDIRPSGGVSTLTHHDDVASVTGISVSPDGRYVALGTVIGEIMVYCTRQQRTLQIIEEAHSGVIQALSWCPWQPNTLATGSLGVEGTVKVWNTNSCKLNSCVETGSEVRDLLWSDVNRELATAQMSSSDNVRLWRYPDLQPVAKIDAHNDGVTQLALSPDGSTLATLGADETLKFWDCFKETKKPTRRRGSVNPSSPLLATIR